MRTIILFLLMTLTCSAQTQIISMLEQWDGAPELQSAMVDAVKANPNADCWSGVTEHYVFGIGIEILPQKTSEDKDIDDERLAKGTAHLRAVKEMLITKVLIDKYFPEGMSDFLLLRRAVPNVAGKIDAKAKLLYAENRTFSSDQFFAGIVAAEKDKIIATMFEPAAMSVVKKSYADELHHAAKKFIREKEYEKAISRLLEVNKIKNFGGLTKFMFLDVFRCFVAMDKLEDAQKIKNIVQKDTDKNLPFTVALYFLAKEFDTPAATVLCSQLEKECTRLVQDQLVDSIRF